MRNTIVAEYRPLDGYVKASASDGGGQCVLVRRRAGEEFIFIRDSKYSRDPRNRPDEEPVIEMPAAAWDAFQAAVLGGSLPAAPGQPHFEEDFKGGVALRGSDGTKLIFTAAEWHAFRAGLDAGEFGPQQAAA